MMRLVLLALAFIGLNGTASGTEVTIPAGDVTLHADYALPGTPPVAPAIVALHGCGGPLPARDRQWRDVLTAAGHPVLLPDSFGSRGLGSQCKVTARRVSPTGKRLTDTVAAAQWLAARGETPSGGVVVMGWSNGGSTVLAAATTGATPPALVRGYVAFYPGCSSFNRRGDWSPGGRLLIVMGESDDWTPVAPCRELAARFPDRIKLVEIPGAYHDFDVPDHPVAVRQGLAFTANGNGVAHAGTNEPGRTWALQAVPAWIAALPPVP
jgi:dienelactone hydrolase